MEAPTENEYFHSKRSLYLPFCTLYAHITFTLKFCVRLLKRLRLKYSKKYRIQDISTTCITFPK